MILYIASSRSARSDSIGRKIPCIHKAWRDLGFSVELVCGGDVYDGGPSPGASARPPTRSRLNSQPGLTGPHASLVHSVSEYRDMRHDRLLKTHLQERIGERKPQLIWHRATRLHLAPLEVAQALGVPYVLEWIDSLVSYRLSLFRWKALAADRRRMREAHRVVVVSERWKQEVADEYRIPLERISVCHNAVKPEEFTREPALGARTREATGIPQDALVVGWVGSYAWYHEAHLIPEAAARLREQNGRPVYFLMVGDGPNRPRVDALCRELGVEDRVRRQGTVPAEDVPRWLSAMDAAVVPASGGEIICPIKVPEYMAASVAPIVADTAAIREVVESEQTGLLFRSGDADSMAGAIRRLLATPGLAGELGRAARAEVVKRFTWQATWGTALQEILAELEPRPGPP